MTEDWITDRLPTEADADKRGEVVAQIPGFKPGDTWSCFLNLNWKHVITGNPWRHTSTWDSAPTTIPRLFTGITHADGRFVAIADDGTAWEDCGNGWEQLAPLPAREVEG